jgi:hypothetical protein
MLCRVLLHAVNVLTISVSGLTTIEISVHNSVSLSVHLHIAVYLSFVILWVVTVCCLMAITVSEQHTASVFKTKNTRRHRPEDHNRHLHRR